MKARLLHGICAAVGLILVFQAGCQQQAKVAESPAAVPQPAPEPAKASPELVERGEPKIEFASMVYDFGKVGPGQKMVGQFKFTNAGDAPLKITNVEKCCGAVTKLDKQELAPGEAGFLQVQYTSSRMPGAMMKQLYVNSNDKATPRAALAIKAETVLRVDYEPKSIKLLLKDQNADCPKITLTSTDNRPFSVTSFQATGDSLTAEIDSVVQATEFILQPLADLAKLQKIRAGRISIGLAYPQANTPPETISISFSALTRFTIMPASLLFVYDKAEQPVKKVLWLTNNYGEDFEIESASSKEGYIKVLSQNKTGNRYQFSLEITAPEGQTKRFEDTFSIKLKDGETLEVKCRGIYKASTTKPAGR